MFARNPLTNKRRGREAAPHQTTKDRRTKVKFAIATLLACGLATAQASEQPSPDER
jgi:hypothetical protein